MLDLVRNLEDRFLHNQTHIFWISETCYRKVPKFWDTRKPCCNLSKILTKRPKLKVFNQNDANGIANSEYPDQTAPLRAVCSGSALVCFLLDFLLDSDI